MKTTFDLAYMALLNRTTSRREWHALYSAYRCALRAYNSSNAAECFLAEGLLSHDLGQFFQSMRHVQRRKGRMETIARKRRQIKVKLHHAATSH